MALALQLGDVNLQADTAVIHRGKGGKARTVPFGPRTGAAIDRYLRARRYHRLASGSALWLGDRGKAFAYFGLRCALADRAKAAGIAGFHPHMMRHTAADRWLSVVGGEGGLTTARPRTGHTDSCASVRQACPEMSPKPP